MNSRGITGALLLAAGGMCPLVHVPVLGNWNYFGIDPLLGSVFYGIVLLALAAGWTGKPALSRICGWSALIWALLTLAAVWFKSHDYFHFMHFKKLISLASGLVKYRWGWLVVLAGSLVLISEKKISSPTYRLTADAAD